MQLPLKQLQMEMIIYTLNALGNCLHDIHSYHWESEIKMMAKAIGIRLQYNSSYVTKIKYIMYKDQDSVFFIITLLTHTCVRVAILFTSRKQLNGWDYLKAMKNLKMSLLSVVTYEKYVLQRYMQTWRPWSYMMFHFQSRGLESAKQNVDIYFSAHDGFLQKHSSGRVPQSNYWKVK